jgi:hypothetical protein
VPSGESLKRGARTSGGRACPTPPAIVSGGRGSEVYRVASKLCEIYEVLIKRSC